MMRVSIVDDEAPVRRLLRKWIEKQGAAVEEAASAEEAWAKLGQGGSFSVALCDLRLPGKDGHWLAEQIHAFYSGTAIVMLTGVHELDAAVSSIQTGAVDYVTKPFTRERLSQALQHAYFAHLSQRELADMQAELEARRARDFGVMA